MCDIPKIREYKSPLSRDRNVRVLHSANLSAAHDVTGANLIMLSTSITLPASAFFWMPAPSSSIRTLVSLSYLWDPVRPAHPSTDQIIDIRMAQGFSTWNNTDTRGWSAVNRAAAYGQGNEIRNLECKRANLRSYTTDHSLGLMTCALWNSNESALDACMDLLQVEEIVDIKHSRGWTL